MEGNGKAHLSYHIDAVGIKKRMKVSNRILFVLGDAAHGSNVHDAGKGEAPAEKSDVRVLHILLLLDRLQN